MTIYQCLSCHSELLYIQYVRSGYCESPACQRSKAQAYLVDRKKKLEVLINNQCQSYLSTLPQGKVKKIDSAYKTNIVLLPANTKRLLRLSDKRKLIFFEHLLTLYQAIENNSPLPSNNHSGELDDPLPAQEEKLLNKACATCKGACCGEGKEHAFQDYASLKYFLEHTVQVKDFETLSGMYADYFPEVSYQGSCIFQSETGCTLPSNFRSFTCNNFRCDSLRIYHNKVIKNLSGLTFAAAVDNYKVKYIKIFSKDLFLNVQAEKLDNDKQ